MHWPVAQVEWNALYKVRPHYQEAHIRNPTTSSGVRQPPRPRTRPCCRSMARQLPFGQRSLQDCQSAPRQGREGRAGHMTSSQNAAQWPSRDCQHCGVVRQRHRALPELLGSRCVAVCPTPANACGCVHLPLPPLWLWPFALTDVVVDMRSNWWSEVITLVSGDTGCATQYCSRCTAQPDNTATCTTSRCWCLEVPDSPVSP